MTPRPPLYRAEPCDSSDPEAGVRLLREGAALNRLTVAEALSLAASLRDAAAGAMSGEPR